MDEPIHIKFQVSFAVMKIQAPTDKNYHLKKYEIT